MYNILDTFVQLLQTVGFSNRTKHKRVLFEYRTKKNEIPTKFIENQ